MQLVDRLRVPPVILTPHSADYVEHIKGHYLKAFAGTLAAALVHGAGQVAESRFNSRLPHVVADLGTLAIAAFVGLEVVRATTDAVVLGAESPDSRANLTYALLPFSRIKRTPVK